MIAEPLKLGLVIVAGFCVAILLAVLVHSASLITYTPLTAGDISADFLSRADRPELVDTVAAQFKQSAQGRSGVASLAYLLTRFGGSVYERDVEFDGGDRRNVFSPSQLVKLALSLGYRLENKQASFTQLPQPGMQPVIAVMSGSRYVVVHSADDAVVFFDPRVGRIVSMPPNDFLRHWQGRILYLGLGD